MVTNEWKFAFNEIREYLYTNFLKIDQKIISYFKFNI